MEEWHDKEGSILGGELVSVGYIDEAGKEVGVSEGNTFGTGSGSGGMEEKSDVFWAGWVFEGGGERMVAGWGRE